MPRHRKRKVRAHIVQSVRTATATVAANTSWQAVAGPLWDEYAAPRIIENVPGTGGVVLNYFLRMIAVGLADACANAFIDFFVGLIDQMAHCTKSASEWAGDLLQYCKEFFSKEKLGKPFLLNSTNGALWQPLVDGLTWLSEKMMHTDDANNNGVAGFTFAFTCVFSALYTFGMKKAFGATTRDAAMAAATNGLSDAAFYGIGPLDLPGSKSGNRAIGYAAASTAITTGITEMVNCITRICKGSEDQEETLYIDRAGSPELLLMPAPKESLFARAKACFWSCVPSCCKSTTDDRGAYMTVDADDDVSVSFRS